MQEYPKFKFEITKISKKEIKIDAFLHVDGNHYLHNDLFLSVNSILKFIKVLGDKKKIYEYEQLPPMHNDFDDIHFRYQGSDTEPLITAIVKHKLDNGSIDCGIISIPLDFLGRKEENMEYITPLIEELKKFII